MNSFRHVDNVQYLKYQEDARLKFFDEFLKEMNPNQFDIKGFNEGTAVGPILSNTACSFKFPLSYPDKILVGATVLPGDMTHDRYKLTHAIWSLKHQRVVAEGYGTVVCYDFAQAKVHNIPPIMREAIDQLVQRTSLDSYDHIMQVSLEEFGASSQSADRRTQQQQQSTA
jgi:acyl-CoA thioester hydrolase